MQASRLTRDWLCGKTRETVRPPSLVGGAQQEFLHQSEEEETKLRPPCEVELCLRNVVSTIEIQSLGCPIDPEKSPGPSGVKNTGSAIVQEKLGLHLHIETGSHCLPCGVCQIDSIHSVCRSRQQG